MTIVPEISIDTAIDRYEVLLFDAYGVLVHSHGVLPGIAAVIDRLNRLGKPYYVLSNDASKLPETAARRYRQFGLSLDPDRILTSGALLAAYFEENDLTGARCRVLGTPDSAIYVERAGGEVVSSVSDFDVLVISDEAGFPFLDTMNQVLNQLCGAIDHGRHIHLLLPNPDLAYPRNDRELAFAAGIMAMMLESALAVRYPGRTGLKFVPLGKPHEHLFVEARNRSGTSSMVMFGDQLVTDIQGARAFGLDAVWVRTGVTAELLAETPDHLKPTYIMDSLSL